MGFRKMSQNRDYTQTFCNDRRNPFHFACRKWYSYIRTHYLYISRNWYDCILTRIIVSILKYKYSSNCMYSRPIIECNTE